MLAAVYTGNLTASLTVRKIVLPITDLKSLVTSPFTISVLANSAPIDFMKRSEQKLIRKIYTEKIEPRLNRMPNSLTKQLEYSYHDPNSVALFPYKAFNYLQYQPPPYNTFKCKFSVSKINIFWNLGAFPVEKDSLYGKQLSQG